MRSQELSCFSPPMMRVMSQGPNCSSMAVSHRYSAPNIRAKGRMEWQFKQSKYNATA